jgi:hypothetical protein
LWRTSKLEDGSYDKDEGRKDSKKGSKRKLPLPQDQREDQELDGQMWFRGMHYNCWG